MINYQKTPSIDLKKKIQFLALCLKSAAKMLRISRKLKLSHDRVSEERMFLFLFFPKTWRGRCALCDVTKV